MTLTTVTAILQQSEYDAQYFTEWYQRHQGESIEVKPEKVTAKFKVVRVLLMLLAFIPMISRVRVVLSMVHCGEAVVRRGIYTIAQVKLAWLKRRGLKVVAIAGSYGKTSTKSLLQQAVSDQLQVLITPKSINTPLGISQVILQDLKPYHQVFVAELGEYYRGDIAALAAFVKPDYGIVTPIGRQHLERMGDIQTIAATIGELIEYFSDSNQVIMAGSNTKHLPEFTGPTYGLESAATYRVAKTQVSRSGTEFELIDPEGQHHVFTPLFGEHQAVNLLPSFWLAENLGLDQDQVVQKCASLVAVTRRHEPTFLDNDILVLDNSYNTNPDSIEASLKLFEQLGAKTRILVTMGFVELGESSEKIHCQLGEKLVSKVDYLGLLETPHAEWIIEGWLKGGGKKMAITTGTSAEDVLQHMQTVITPGSVIILEGGYKELFT